MCIRDSDYTLEVTLEQPTPYALFLFSFGTLAPINQRFYEAVGADLYSTEAQYFLSLIHIWQADAPELNIEYEVNPFPYSFPTTQKDCLQMLAVLLCF